MLDHDAFLAEATVAVFLCFGQGMELGCLERNACVDAEIPQITFRVPLKLHARLVKELLVVDIAGDRLRHVTNAAALVHDDLGFYGMRLLFSRVAGIIFPSLSPLLGGVDNKVRNRFFGKVRLLDRQVNDRFDDRADSGEIAADAAVVDVKQGAEKRVRRVGTDIEQQHRYALLEGQLVTAAAAPLDFTGMPQPLGFCFDPERLNVSGQFVKLSWRNTEQASEHYGALFKF